MSSVQLLVFDSRRGNEEGYECEKILGFYPPNTRTNDQISISGLIQGLLTFSSAFNPTTVEHPSHQQKQHYEIIENEGSIWVIREIESGIYLAILASKSWLPRHVPQDNLLAALVHTTNLMGLLFYSIQTLLDKDRTGTLARSSIASVLSHVGYELSTAGSWMHRELRSPFTSLGRALAASLSLTAMLDVHSLCHRIQLVSLPGEPNNVIVEDVAVFYKSMLLWSTLPPANTSRLSSLVCSSIFAPILQSGHRALPLSSPSSLASSHGVAHRDGRIGSENNFGTASMPTMAQGKNLQVFENGFVVLKQGNKNTEEYSWMPSYSTYEVPFIYDVENMRRPMLAYSKCDIVILNFLSKGRRRVDQSILHALGLEIEGPSSRLAVKLMEESREQGGELGHIPGWRYALHDAGSIRASPRSKVSAMSHHSRALGTAVMDSLSRMHRSSMVLPPCVPWKAEGNGHSTDGEGERFDAEDAFAEDVDMCVRSCQGSWVIARGTPRNGQMSLVVREKKVEGIGVAAQLERIEANLRSLSLV